MPSLLDEIRQFLPLIVRAAEADAGGVRIGGDNWSLRINTNWRVLHQGVVAMSPAAVPDIRRAHGLNELVGDALVKVYSQSGHASLDLGATTQAGRVLEIFSDFAYGEWLLSIWQEAEVPILDIEGPVKLE